MRVSVLGAVDVDASGPALGRRDRIVLLALALDLGQTVSSERLADALWHDTVPPTWAKVVQGCIVRLRKALGQAAIETHPDGYRLTIPPDEVDVQRFERLLGRARELFSLGQPERAMVAAEDALALWRGRPFVDAEDWEPAQLEAHRLDQLRLEAEELRLEAALRSGRHREVLASARTCVESSPTRERRWELLALAQYRAGHQAEALRALREARAVLVREHGLDPGPGLAALEQAILRQDPGLDAPGTPGTASSTSPWPGLLSYGIDDADEFFGRGEEIATCLRRLETDRIVVVVGASGSGKSSLVRAGIAASLRRNGQPVVVMTPDGESTPEWLSSLSLAGGARPVLVVDQLEEAVSLGGDDNSQRDFLDALVDFAGSGRLVLALRADRVADISAHVDLARLVERGLFLLGPMGEADVRAAIEGPARRSALLLEPGLVDLVVRDVLDEPGALPLMSHALRQTWVGREGRTLTVAAYTGTGGIRGAVAQSAERVYSDIGPDERQRLRDLMMRLVSPGLDGEPARVRVPRLLLSRNPAYEPLIERLVAARLLTSDDEAVEVAHEALARAWPRLKNWLDEDIEGLRSLRHLTTAADEWDALGRPSSELYRGVRLTQALAWRRRAHPDLTPVEEAFLDASVGVEAADLEVARVHLAREQRVVRRLRRLVAGVAVLAVIAGIASAIAVGQRNRADDEARVAEARRISASALVAKPYDRALLLAVEAVHLWDSPETRGNLLTTITRSPSAAGVIRGRARLLDVELAPDGASAAVADNTGHVTVYDLVTGKEQRTLSRSGTLFGAPTYSPDGSRLALARRGVDCGQTPQCDHGVDVFRADDLTSGPITYGRLNQPAADVAWSPDGSLLAAAEVPMAAAPRDDVTLWRVEAPGQPHRRLTLPHPTIPLSASPDSGPRTWISFSPDGTRLYASRVGPTVVFDVATGQTLRTYKGMGSLALSPDGATLAIGMTTTRVALVDTMTGRTRAELTSHRALVTAAAFSADGKRLATASNDESVSVWDTTNGERVSQLFGHAGSVFDVAFGRDGSTLHTSAADRSLITWDVSGSSGLARLRARPSARLAAAQEGAVLLSPTGESVMLHGGIVDVGSGRYTPLSVPPTEMAWAAYARDGRSLATVGWDGTTRLRRTSDGAPLATRPGRGAENYGAIAFTDGGTIVVADRDGTVVELRGTTLEPTGRSLNVGLAPDGIRAGVGDTFAVTGTSPDTESGTDIVFGDLRLGRVQRRVHTESGGLRAAFSPDGERYAFGGFDGRLGVVDVETGVVAGPRDPAHAGPISWVAFSPDGSTLAAIGFDGTLSLSDAATAVAHARVQPGPTNQRSAVSFDPDGHTALIAYEDGSVIAYETDPAAWIAHACRVAGRDLTADELRDAFGDPTPRRTCSVMP